MPTSNPDLLDVVLATVRPTQMTVGFAEVAQKRQQWEEAKRRRRDFLPKHVFPGVRGPRDRIYITDHHHLGRALMEEGVESVYVSISHDFSGTFKAEFWTLLDHLNLVHPYDPDGHRRPFDDMPKKLTRLTDDPYRSLAAQVRDAGGYAKNSEAFAEFLWADFLRRRIPVDEVRDHPQKACADALALCHGPKAAHLPGWSGPTPGPP